MAESSDVNAGDTALATQYNNLRKDVLDPTVGHAHTGADSKALATNSVGVTQIASNVDVSAKNFKSADSDKVDGFHIGQIGQNYIPYVFGGFFTIGTGSYYYGTVTIKGHNVDAYVLTILSAITDDDFLVRVSNEGYFGIKKQFPLHTLHLGNDDAAKPATNTWTIVSDIRIKKEITPFNDGLDIIKQLNPVNFKHNGKADLPLDLPGISLIANDVKDIIPYCVSTYKTKLEESDVEKTELYNLNNGALIYILVNAVKELSNKIEHLETKLNKLEAKIK